MVYHSHTDFENVQPKYPRKTTGKTCQMVHIPFMRMAINVSNIRILHAIVNIQIFLNWEIIGRFTRSWFLNRKEIVSPRS